MCEVPVFYATTDGQTRRIAARIVSVLRAAGLTSDAIDLGSKQAVNVDWAFVRGAIVGASLRVGHHPKAAAAFVEARSEELNARPSWFFSVSLSAASKNPSEVDAARRLAGAFADEARWRPRQILCVAGRLAYTQYGWLTRAMMRRIARKEGASTDTSRDHELTDWAEVETFGQRCAAAILSQTLDAPASVATAGVAPPVSAHHLT